MTHSFRSPHSNAQTTVYTEKSYPSKHEYAKALRNLAHWVETQEDGALLGCVVFEHEPEHNEVTASVFQH